MSVWFEGSKEIACSLDDVVRSFEDVGQHFVGVVERMPGMLTVELTEADGDSVTIRTNEGMMHRTGIRKRAEEGRLVVEFDERYVAGSKVTVTSHHLQEFTPTAAGVRHRLVVSDVSGSGVLGFVYRKFAGRKMGPAFLQAAADHLERSTS